MKKSSRLVAFLMVLCMLLVSTTITAFAEETDNFAPEEAVAFSQENNAVAPCSMDYQSYWVPAGVTEGYFAIEKTFSGTGHITYKATSDNTSVHVRMCVSKYTMGALMSITGWMSVSTNGQEYKPEGTMESKGTFYVNFEFPSGNPEGTFLMCWIYG